jgi:5-methylcytosine-specific restriction endonuclease McrA
MSILATTPPKHSKRWNEAILENPEARAAFERATALKIHRGHLMSKHPFCSYCGRKLTKKSATLDHRIPLTQGGTDDWENLVLSCHSCNQCKAGRDPIQWAADILAGCVIG